MAGAEQAGEQRAPFLLSTIAKSAGPFCEQARQAAEAAAAQRTQLHVLMLETKLRVLHECYAHLEASTTQLQPRRDVGSAGGQPLLPHGAAVPACSALAVQGAEEPCAPAPGPHLALAHRCAELEFNLFQEQQVGEGAQLFFCGGRELLAFGRSPA